MITVYGHEQVMKRLRTHIPQVMLFAGTPSVGKATVAQWVREELRIESQADFLSIKHLDEGTVEVVSRFLQLRPRVFKGKKLAVIYLGASLTDLQAMLYHPLERMDPQAHVIFISRNVESVSPYLTSRAESYHFGLLGVLDVENILLERGFSENAATHLAQISEGQVSKALRFNGDSDVKAMVVAAVHCLLERDPKSLDTFADRWTDVHTEFLAELCRQSISRRHVVFPEEHAEALPRALAVRILTALRPDVRPRFVVRSLLMGVLMGDQ